MTFLWRDTKGEQDKTRQRVLLAGVIGISGYRELLQKLPYTCMSEGFQTEGEGSSFNFPTCDIGAIKSSGNGHSESSSLHQGMTLLLLVLCDYATRYPEAIALHSIDAEHIAEELMKLFSRVGVPKEIPMDRQGSNFTSCTIPGRSVQTVRSQGNSNKSLSPADGWSR